MKSILYLALVAALPLVAQDKPRVFVTDSQSWQVTGGGGASWNNGSGSAASHVVGRGASADGGDHEDVRGTLPGDRH
jgi:hypothetical protein